MSVSSLNDSSVIHGKDLVKVFNIFIHRIIVITYVDYFGDVGRCPELLTLKRGLKMHLVELYKSGLQSALTL